MNTEKINFDNINHNEELEEKENNFDIKNNFDIIKRNITFEKDEIILDSIVEEEYSSNNINKSKPIKGKNKFLLKPYQSSNKRKNNEKKIRIKHKDLCHKFTDNPQHFFTVKLNDLMLKALNINIKGRKKKLVNNL